MSATENQAPDSAEAEKAAGGADQPPPFDANAGIGSIASLAVLASASGELAAQRFIRDEWSQQFHDPELPGPDSDLTDAVGLVFARLCAARGDRSDANMLAVLLLNVGNRFHNRGRNSVGWECIAESLSLYERLGGAGDTEAVNVAKSLLSLLPIEVIARAKEYTLKGKNDGTPAAPACIRALH